MLESVMVNTSIPTVDLSPFFNAEHEEERKIAKAIITHACSEYGFFQIMNHGVPRDLMGSALELSKKFFEFPVTEKLKFSPKHGAPLPAGYNIQPEHAADKNEYLLMFSPGADFNVFPTDPPELREVMEEMYTHLTKTAFLMENILSECLGLPPTFLKEYNTDRSSDFMVTLGYFPATETEKNGLTEHQDANCFTFVFEDEGGLEVIKDGVWIPVVPIEGSLIVNVGDVIQVLSNNKFKSATHRVVTQEGRRRHSYAFFNNLGENKWVEPLAEFTEQIGEPAKYRGFFYNDYQQLRFRDKKHPPSRPEDAIHISRYAIPS